MKIRTLEHLSQRLWDDLAWRKKEISDLKSLVETKSFNTILA